MHALQHVHSTVRASRQCETTSPQSWHSVQDRSEPANRMVCARQTIQGTKLNAPGSCERTVRGKNSRKGYAAWAKAHQKLHAEVLVAVYALKKYSFCGCSTRSLTHMLSGLADKVANKVAVACYTVPVTGPGSLVYVPPVRYTVYHGTVYHGTCTMSDVHHSRGGRMRRSPLRGGRTTHMVHVPWYSVPWYM